MLLTRPPLIHSPKRTSSLDLHVLGTPPAFVLSQDQTLNKKFNLCSYFNKRIAGLLIVYYILFNFQRPLLSSPSSDFFSLSLLLTSVNNFLKSFLDFHFFLFYQEILLLYLPQRQDISYHFSYLSFPLKHIVLFRYY